MNSQLIPELAPCGIWCGACPSFEKTCLGCASESHLQKRTSKWNCKVRVCCYDHENRNYCIECGEFPCSVHKKKLTQSHQGDPRFQYRHELPENSRMLVKLGPEKYIDYQKNRFNCPDCGGLVYFYHYTCIRCGKHVNVK